MHLAVIPDGNRRFGKERGLDLWTSYRGGIEKFEEFLRWCREVDGIEEVTVYALSSENLRERRPDEVKTLLRLFLQFARKFREERKLEEEGIRLRICGDLNAIEAFEEGKELIATLKELEASSQRCEDYTLNLALAYSGREEILQAARKLVEEGKELTEENLREHLWVKSYPDLLIRTAEARISNFLLWQLAYTEIYLIPKLWQELRREDFLSVLEDFKRRQRRFGR